MADVEPLTLLRRALALVPLPLGVAWGVFLDWRLAVGWAVVALCIRLEERLGFVVMAGWVLWASMSPLDYIGADAVLIASLAMIFAMFDEADQRTLVQVQTVVLYAFAGLNKLNGDYLSGMVMERGTDGLPFPQVLSVVGVAVELWLAVAVSRRWGSALPVAALLHVGITATLVVTTQTAIVKAALVLGTFNGLLVIMVAVGLGQRRLVGARDRRVPGPPDTAGGLAAVPDPVVTD